MISTELIQHLDPEGRATGPGLSDVSPELALRMYRLMLLTRAWMTKALSLQRQGRMGTLASVRGQEASNVGMGLALADGDWFVPAFREYGALFARGVSPRDQFIYWGGDERGARPPEGSRVVPTSIIVGGHLPHAAGIAMAAKIKGEKNAVLSSSGDGSTSQGDFHEALNFAGVNRLPVVFAIQNNGWAISTPAARQTATATIAEKAAAYGITGLRVDGNDVYAVYLTVKRLLDEARESFSPALCELVTYRMDDHTTSDDAKRYRPEALVAPWRGKDPIDRLRRRLGAAHGWDDAKDAALAGELAAEVERAVREYEANPAPPPSQVFEHIYAEMPWNLREQREEVLARHGGSRG